MAQKKSIDHIFIGDSSYHQGWVSLIGKGKLEFKTSDIGKPIIYSLEDLSEYSTHGSTYEAMVIQSKRTFYRRYVNGQVSLYYNRGTYVVKSGNVPTPFRRSNFRSVLSSVIKCEGNDASLFKLSYTKAAIKGIVTSHNSGDCNTDLISYRKFGIVAGYNFITTRASPTGTNKFKETNAAPSVGLFLDLPMAFKKGIYLTLEASGTAFQPSYYNQSPVETAFMVLRINAINASASLKFIRQTGTVKPYVKLGALASFLQINCPTGLLTTETDGTTINVMSMSPFTPTNTTQFGINSAVGVEIPVHRRKNLHLEIRYTRSIGDAMENLDLNLSNIGVTAGFNF